MKNIIKNTTILLFVAGLLVFSSCEKFLDVNTDPNNPTEVTPDLVLPVAQKYTANLIDDSDGGGRRLNTLGNLMMYNWSQSDGFAWYPDEFKYLVTASFYQSIFEQSYTNALKQYNLLENLDPKYDYYKAIGMIMEAFHYQLLVDCYGDIPYSEALQRGELSTPKYDKAQTVYEDLMVKLTDAIALINKEGTDLVTPAGDDIMFGGDMLKWKQFANTVKLRILVRQMSMSGRSTYIQAEFNKITAEGDGFMNEDVTVNPGYITGTEGKQNPFYNHYGINASGTQTMTGNATCATDYIIDYLQTQTNDPRINYIYEQPASGHLGVPQGLLDYDTPVPDAYVPDKVSNIGPGLLKGGDQDAVIYTLAECYLNQAEAVLDGYIAGDAKTLYESGVQASFDYLGAGSATSYLGQSTNNVAWDSSPDKLEAIITQKWIAENGITAEQSWFDYSRTGFPAGLPVSLLASTPDRPVRLYYPASELTSNGDNVPTQPSAFTAKIFWAK
ncbi:MAG: SusD/RagB family nutrient-binding outer membrane lipoprotein [Bacteroidales bacterium]|nr:SusD/RagB family nutrient-binding outer membrane lipoprotein [Bacteroidales bacterium]